MRNANGEAFEIEYLSPSEGTRMPDWELNLEKLGIALKIRSVDFALYRRVSRVRLRHVTIVEGDFTLPSPTDLSTSYGSKAADEKGSNNLRGVKSPAVDSVLEGHARRAHARRAARRRARARPHRDVEPLQVPDLYASDEKASYWNRFGMPAVRPKYFTLESAISEWPAWAVTAWWILDPAKR